MQTNTAKIIKVTIMRRIILALLMLPAMAQAQTLEECQQAAERNYPLIQQYGLIDKIYKAVENGLLTTL